MLDDLKKLYQYRELLWVWTLRDIKVRYKQSLLGAVWAILQPLALMIMFSVVFSLFIQIPSDGIPYPIFSYTALLPWTFFAASIPFAASSLVNNMNLVSRIYFPREILPISSIIAAFFDFLVASSIFVALMAFYQMPIGWSFLWLPILLAVQIFLTIGIAFFASALMVWYRYLRFVVPVGIQILLYASPIIYSVSVVPEQLLPWYMLNPLAGLMDSYRRVILLGEAPNMYYLAWATLVALVVLITGYRYFSRSEGRFADII